jgi:N-acetylneuraminic acid mutarotase
MGLIKRYFFLIIMILQFYACTDNYELTPITTWKQLSNFPGVARASASSFVVGDKAFVCLGRSGEKGGFLKDVWEYDSNADSWTRKADFPGAARVKAIAGVIGDKAYVGLGGVSAYVGNQFSDFWEYDSSSDTWKQLASFPGKAKNDLFCAVVDSCLYTTEGFTATGFNQDTYKYSPKTNSWTRLKNCPVCRSSTAGFSIGNDFYVGTGYFLTNFKDFYCYHTLTDSWSRMADLPDARILSKGITINGKGYIMLGRYWDGSLDGGKLLKDIVEYDPLENKWIRCGDFPGGARQNMVVFTINGKGYIVGGEDDSERKSDVWMFTPSP